VTLAALAGLHLLAALVHGSAHALVPVTLAPWTNALVLATVFVGPVAGVWLDRRGHPLGVPLFTVTMAGALVLGGVLHFLVAGPDHVDAVPPGPWRLPFRASAATLLASEALGVAVGARRWLAG
jgi:ABC-type xylose transport system permease subunit